MRVRHIVVATDESETGRHAVHAAIELALAAGARLTVMTTVPVPSGVPARVGELAPERAAEDEAPELGRLRQWLAPDFPGPPPTRVDVAAAFGLPGVEIARFAEEREADLLVLGRKRRTFTERLVVGDTADAVARRSRVPCLFVPLDAPTSFRRVLVALDGSDRGLAVFNTAVRFACFTGADLHAVTVERHLANEPGDLAAALPSARSQRLAERLLACPGKANGGNGNGHRPNGATRRIPLAVRRGEPAARILEEITALHADVLVVGYRRGGPPAVVDAGSVSRRLVHEAPTATLTVPL